MNNRIDLSKIPTFLSVAEHLSFSEASYELYTTQSSVSKSISALESSLGFPLFIRKNRKIALTPSGNFLYNELSKSMRDINQIFIDAKKLSEGKTGSFTIGIAGYLAKIPKFMQICSSFSVEYPEFEFELKSLEYQNLKKSLINSETDAILYHSIDIGSTPQIKYLLLMKSEAILICNPYTKIKHYSSLADFASAKFISVHPSCVPDYQNYLINCCKSYGFTPNISKYTDSVFELIQYISNSDYVTVTDRSIFSIPATDLCILHINPKKDIQNVDTVFAWMDTNTNPVLNRFITTAAKNLAIHG